MPLSPDTPMPPAFDTRHMMLFRCRFCVMLLPLICRLRRRAAAKCYAALLLNMAAYYDVRGLTRADVCAPRMRHITLC